MALTTRPDVAQWLSVDWSFLRLKDDDFKNKTAEKAELYKRESDWAWALFHGVKPTHGFKQDGKWSGTFGQCIFEELIPNGRKPSKKGRFQLDWEDDNFVYELKTQFHLSGGTAQEKIPAVPIKYLKVPELFGKPLRVVCFAGAETYAKEFFEDGPKMRQQLDLWKSWDIEYVWGSDLIKDMNRT